MKIEEFVSQIADMKSAIASLQKTKNNSSLLEPATRLSDLHKVSSVTFQGQTKDIFMTHADPTIVGHVVVFSLQCVS